MEKILVLAHVEADGTLAKPAREALGAARSVQGAELIVGLVGTGVSSAARMVGACGARQYLGVEGAAFAQPRYSTDAAAAEALVKASGASLIIAAATSRWARSLAGAAQRLGGRVDTHITGLRDNGGVISVSRWYYRQRMEALLQRTERPWFLLLDAGCFEPWTGDATEVPLELLTVATNSRTAFVEYRAPMAGEQTIRPDAALLFVAGAGWTKKQADGQTHVEEAGDLILGFLRHTQASLGSSKSLVDLGGEGQAVLPFLSHLNQVGQTGSTPRHPKGLAACCHGEEPHVVGWRFINERRVVNLDANCAWAHGKADVLYVADAFEVMAKVNALLAG